jgi:flagella basal body P-ring formation protein FlgA
MIPTLTAMQMYLYLLFIIATACTPLHADEMALQSHDTIKSAAKAYLTHRNKNYGSRINISIGRLDSRLKLRACTQELSTFSPPGRQSTGKTTVGIRCEDNKPWSIYVTAQVGVMEQVVIANRNIPRGTQLTSADIHLEERDITQLHRGYLTEISQAINKTLARNVRQGTPLSPSKINASTVVKRGANVTILSSVGSIEVRMKGIALEKGSIGDRIKVKNSRSKQQVNAVIISSTLVKVAP